MESSALIVILNAEKPGPPGQKFSKPPLKELDEAFELLSDENVLAIAADYKILDVSLPIFHLDEISKIANFILKKVGLK